MAVLGFSAQYQDMATPGLSSLGRTYDRVRSTVSGLTSAVEKNTQRLQTISLGAGIASLGLFKLAGGMKNFFGTAADEAMEFQVASKNLQFMLRATTAEMKDLNAEAFKIGNETLFSATEASKAWYQLVSFGLGGVVKLASGAEKGIAQLALRSTLNFSTMSAGTVDLAESAAFAGQLVNKLNIDMSKVRFDERGREITLLDRAMDMLAKTTQITGFQVRDFPIAFNSMRSALQDVNMELPTAMAMAGVMKTMGLSAADAGHMMVGLNRRVSMFASKVMTVEAFQKMGRGTGARAKMREYWIKQIFPGGVKEFEKAVTDARGNVGNMIDLFAKLQTVIEQKFGKEKTAGGFRRMGFLQKFFGDTMTQQGFRLMSQFRHELTENVYAVDEWGDHIVRGGKKVLLFSKGVHTGFRALKAMEAQIKMSQGEAAKYTKMMEQTTWGLKKLQQGVRQTFMIVLGQHVLPILNKFYQVLFKIVSAMGDFARAHPIITKILVVLGLTTTALIAMGAVAAGAIAVFSFMTLQFGKVGAGLFSTANFFKKVTVSATSATAAVGRYNMATKTMGAPLAGGALPKKGTSILRTGKGGVLSDVADKTKGVTVAGGKSYTIWNKILGLFKRMGGFLKSALLKLKSFWRIGGILGGVFLIVAGVVNIIKKNIFGVGDALGALRSWFMRYIVQPFIDFGNMIKRMFIKVRFILMALFTDKVYAEDIEFLGKDALGLIDLLNTGFFKFVRNIIVFFRRVGWAIDEVRQKLGYLFDGISDMAMVGGGIGLLMGVLFGPGGMIIGGIIGSVLGSIVGIIINMIKNWSQFRKDAGKVWESFKRSVFLAIGDLGKAWKKFVSWLANWWHKTVQKLPRPIRFLVDVFEFVFVSIIKGIGIVISTIADIFRGESAVSRWVERVWDSITGVFGRLWSWIKTSRFGRFMSTLWDGVVSGAKFAWQEISGILNKITAGFTSLAEKIGSVFSSIWGNIKSGFYKFLSTVYGAMAILPGQRGERYRAASLGYTIAAEGKIDSKMVSGLGELAPGVDKKKIASIVEGVEFASSREGEKKVVTFNFGDISGLDADQLSEAVQKALREKDRNLLENMDELRVTEGGDTSKVVLSKSLK
jgi:TP901 family phage tail tape measure protein